jgi:hypothetical protein
MAAAVGDPPQLLDVHVDQRAGTIPDISDSARPTVQAGRPFGPIAAHPFGGRLPADPGHRGGVGNRPAIELDPVDQEPPAKQRPFGPTMHPESPPLVWSRTPQIPRTGLSPVNDVFLNHTLRSEYRQAMPSVGRDLDLADLVDAC